MLTYAKKSRVQEQYEQTLKKKKYQQTVRLYSDKAFYVETVSRSLSQRVNVDQDAYTIS